MSSGASGSGWIWNPDKGAYLNPKTGTWATPQSGGEWSYSDSVDVRAKEVVDEEEEVEEDGEIDGEPIPEDQVWPGGPDASEADYSQAPILRFVVLHSDVLPSQQVGIPDPGETLSFGRDRSFEKRIRLKELPVSKTHATCFWLERGLENEDKGEGCWAVADCGSTHGTWVKADGDQKALRLSPPKVASAPRELHHLDSLTIGSTTFTVHLHSSFACQACTVLPDVSNVIPLLSPDEKVTTSTKPGSSSIPPPTTKTKAEKEEERRRKMRGLKDQFLKPPPVNNRTVEPSVEISSKEPIPATPVFVDRAKARRLRTAVEAKQRASTTIGPSRPTPSPFFSVPGATTSSITSQPPTTPFSSTSKGAVLLSKLTKPSDSETGLGTLIQPRTFDVATTGKERPGLGSKPLVDISGGESEAQQVNGGKRGWREDVREANRKRFREMEAS